MIVKKILIGVLLILSMLFLIVQTYQFEVVAAGIRVLLLALLIVLYWYRISTKKFFFYGFLISFGVAEILNFSGWISPIPKDGRVDHIYYSANVLYMLSYMLLVIQMLSNMDVVSIVKKFPLHIITMLILDVIFVMIVTDTTLNRLSNAQYFMELVYNAVVMILLTVALLNFSHRDDKKSIFLLVASICIMLSEVIQLAYFYVSSSNVLNVICSFFLVLAFAFFYLQTGLNYEKHDDRRFFKDLAA